MPARMIVCHDCDGRKVDEVGHKCLECQGLGTFLYGEDRPHEQILRDLEDTRRILELSEAERSRAKGNMRGCPPERREQVRRHIQSCEWDVKYWEWRIEALNRELEATPRPVGAAP
jgi:hypothetical protein